MNRKYLVDQLEPVLGALGFVRQKATWNRRLGEFVDVVDFQVSKAGGTFALNLGVVHIGVYERCWAETLPAFVSEPQCVIRERLGVLATGLDRWYNFTKDDVDEALAAVKGIGLSFLEMHHTKTQMKEYLEKRKVAEKKYPPPIIYLALLYYDLGSQTTACQILNKLQRIVMGAWRHRIAVVRQLLGCKIPT